jgi:hypothetical protein
MLLYLTSLSLYIFIPDLSFYIFILSIWPLLLLPVCVAQVWDSTRECLSAVRGAGYQIVATHLTRGSVAIQVWEKTCALLYLG